MTSFYPRLYDGSVHKTGLVSRRGTALNNVTIKDVAKYCGVSVSTVSRCLNGYTDISEDTVSKVFEAIRKLDYVPSNAARQITKKNTKQILNFS